MRLGSGSPGMGGKGDEMALNRIATEVMVEHSSRLLDPETDEHRILAAHPLTAPLLPELAGAQAGLLESQPAPSSAVALLTEQLTALDWTHDEDVRGIDERFASELRFTTDDALRKRFEDARGTVLPTGIGIVQRSYEAQAGEGKLRATRIEKAPEVRALMAELPVHGGQTLADKLDELQSVAAQIGVLEKRRTALGKEGELVVKNRDARTRWMRVINAIATNLALRGVDELTVLGGIREAEAKAEKATSTTTTSPVVTPPADLDPPPPADDPSDPGA